MLLKKSDPNKVVRLGPTNTNRAIQLAKPFQTALGNAPVRSPLASVSTGKKKILCWSDAVFATTGFGVVAKNILKSLHDTGRYEIDQLAINYFGTFYDREKYPYQISPARLKDHNDLYGYKTLPEVLAQGNYDYLFVINDTFTTQPIAGAIAEVRSQLVNARKKPFKIVYYYPVDSILLPTNTTMLQIADKAIAYTQFAAAETNKVIAGAVSDIIYHGVDTNMFRALPTEERLHWRQNYLRIPDPETFIVTNVNRNSRRKNFFHTIRAFAEFRKSVPNSRLYLHTKSIDGSNPHDLVNLAVPIFQLGLKSPEDVMFPKDFNPADGVPESILNRIYCCADAFITTTLGEGFGLSTLEAASCGVPLIVPDNTVHPELYENKAYFYPCKEDIFADNSGCRKYARTEDIVGSLLECYMDWKTDKQKDQITRASDFAKSLSWENIGMQWIQLFRQLDETAHLVPAQATTVELL